MPYRLLADLLVVFHLGFVLFVVLGGLVVLRWPRLARTVMAVEPRLPKALQMTLVVYARRK